MLLHIAKESFRVGNPEGIQNKITRTEWLQVMKTYDGVFIWLEDTPDGKIFYEMDENKEPKKKALFDFDIKKGYHKTFIDFVEDWGRISITVSKTTLPKLLFAMEMAKKFNAFLFADGKLVDDLYIEKYKAKLAPKKEAK